MKIPNENNKDIKKSKVSLIMSHYKSKINQI